MKCKKPYQKGVASLPCGQCMPCRIDRRRTWVARMILERAEHQHACFLTLTYNDESLPQDLCVDKEELQRFFKRLRKEIHPRTIRYFACGEYGDQNQRPHYHAIVFGISPTERDLVKKVWQKGFFMLGSAEPATMTYCAGYVTKKMTKKGDPRLEGRKPEFALMSRNPGLGMKYVDVLTEVYLTDRGQVALQMNGWIAGDLILDGKRYKLAKSMKEKLIERLELTPEQRKEHLKEYYAKCAMDVAGMTATQIAEKRKIEIEQQSYPHFSKRYL